MIVIRRSQDRGKSAFAWLESYHTFSFAHYYAANHMGFGCLRVINEDYIEPGQGFGRHAHANMEILTYVVNGSLVHQDSLGTGSIIGPGEIQRMSAGVGVEHSEFNHSATDALHLLQIWIKPAIRDLPASYEQKKINQEKNKLILIAGPAPNDVAGAVLIQQEVKLFCAHLLTDSAITYEIDEKRMGWLQLIKGQLRVNGHLINAGDGVAITMEKTIEIASLSEAEFLLFDLSSVQA